MGVERQTISVSVETRADACKKKIRKGSYAHREESLQASTNIYIQGKKLLEYLNNGIE